MSIDGKWIDCGVDFAYLTIYQSFNILSILKKSGCI